MNPSNCLQNKTKATFLKHIFIITTLFLMFILTISAGHADTHIYVDAVNGKNFPVTPDTVITGDIDDPFLTITWALNRADIREYEEPWIVHIKAGRYDANPDKMVENREFFPIPLRSNMVLIGDDGAENCIISGEFTTGGISPLAKGGDTTNPINNITIQNLTFEKMERTISDAETLAGSGGIDLFNAYGKISNCIFIDNSTSAAGGGAVWLSQASGKPFLFHQNLFLNNSTSARYYSNPNSGGGAIHVHSSFLGTISGNEFVGNTGQGGGGFNTTGNFNGKVVDNTFTQNGVLNSADDGGAFMIDNSFYGVIARNVFFKNFLVAYGNPGLGAGFMIGKHLYGDIEDNIFTGNYMTRDGGYGVGFYVESRFAGKIVNNIFSGNYTSGHYGGRGAGFELNGDHYYIDPPVEDTIIANNYFLYNSITPDVQGASVYLDYMDVTIANNTFWGGNSGESNIYLSTDAASSVIENNIFAGLYTAIEQELDVSPLIQNNNFDSSSIVNILTFNAQEYGTNPNFVDGMILNCQDNKGWSPGVVGENIASGTWTNSIAYDPETNLTTLTDQKQNWQDGQFRGALLNISTTSMPLHFKIIENTQNKIRVMGNINQINSGDSYSIDNYQLSADSLNIGTATDVGLTQDNNGDLRPSEGSFDIGADEFLPTTGNIFTISATASLGGEISNTGTSYIHEGYGKDYTITPYAGYYISDVLIDGVSIGVTDHYSFSFVIQDHTIEVIFVSNFDQYTITASSGSGGVISPLGNTFVEDQGGLVVTITPDTDYQILDVLVDNVSVGPVSEYIFSSVSENHTIYATFEYSGTAVLSEISLNLSTNSVTMGDLIEVTGHMTPPTLGGAFVDIAMIPPSGPTIHRTVLANSLGDFSYTLQCSDIRESGEWTIQASWQGDYILEGNTSTGQILDVAKADASLILDSSSLVIKFGYTVPFIGGLFTPTPRCGADLSGIPIKIEISGPNGESDIQTISSNDKWGHFSLLNYDGLNALGKWTLRAVFDGDDGFKASLSEEMTINVVETAGYAIIVQGKLTGEEGLLSHNKTTDLVYNTLRNRGLQEDDIFYFNYDDTRPDDGSLPKVNATPSWSGIKDAVTIWARDRIDPDFINPNPGEDVIGKPANLFIVMIDHGLDEQFHIDTDTAPVVISSTDLSAWQTTLQDGLTGDAADQEIISILGFCRSGSFINELSGPNRVIITSADEGESSYKGPMDQADSIREGEYFVSELFKAASYGKSVRQCFMEAVALTEAFTSSDKILSANSPFGDNSRQHPLLDDNADGIGSNDLDNSGDGEFSDTLFFGITPLTGNDPGDVTVTTITPTLFLDDIEDSAMLWARVDNNTGMSSLWAEIKPPGYDPVDTGTSGQATMDLFVVPLTEYDPAWDYYKPATLPDVFTVPGIYNIYYFAKDSDTGHVSSLKQSIVYKNPTGNLAPDDFHLLYPDTVDDPVFRTSGFILGWQTTTDPDEDALTYTVDIINDPSDPRWGAQVFSFTIEHLTHAMVFIGPEASFIQNRRYIWQVKAIDQYGATTVSLETDWTFEINNDNAINGWISGGVFDMNDTAILDADVAVQGFYIEMLTDNNGGPTGYYMGTGHPGDYQLTATASGYETNNRQVTLLNGGFSNGDITLPALSQLQVSDPLVTPTSGTYTPALEINISCDTPDADIYYTKDGSDPDEGSFLYQGAFNLIGNGEFTLKAKAYAGSWSPSNIVAVDFTLIPDPGDFNGNGQIGIDDVQVLSDGFGEADQNPESPSNADTDNDGDVDGLDIIELIDAMNAL